MGLWTDAVLAAVRRQASRHPQGRFTRQGIIKNELSRITTEVRSAGVTPEQTLSRELQELAELGQISFVDNRGTYQLVNRTHDKQLKEYAAKYFVDGFRSLRSFDIELERGLNALVGPNGSGKTNFIEFLDFLSNVISDDASSAVSSSGGVARVFSQENMQGKSPKLTARLTGIADLTRYYADPERLFFFKFEYFIEIRFSKANSAIYISNEKIEFYSLYSQADDQISDNTVGTVQIRRRSPAIDQEPKIEISQRLLDDSPRNPLRYARRSLPRTSAPRLVQSGSDPVISSPPGPDESFLSNQMRPALDAVRAAISRGRVFNIDPGRAREPDELTKPALIRPDGSGLSATLYHMQQAARAPSTPRSRYWRFSEETFDSVVEWTKMVLPDLINISASSDPHTGKYLVSLTSGSEKSSLRFPLQTLSDGTVKWLSFLCMIFSQPGSYSIEEPENFLHPKMQQALIDVVRDTLEPRRPTDYFLMSTHSESIINRLDPSELILFSFFGGRTSCRRLQNVTNVADQINDTGFGLGYYYASNAVS